MHVQRRSLRQRIPHDGKRSKRDSHRALIR
jgi:hypothetical protein